MPPNDTPRSAVAPARRPTLTLKSRPKRTPTACAALPTIGPRLPANAPAALFWINWRVDGHRPKRRHSTLERALAERDRLRAAYPGADIHTFECRLIELDGTPVAQPAE